MADWSFANNRQSDFVDSSLTGINTSNSSRSEHKHSSIHDTLATTTTAMMNDDEDQPPPLQAVPSVSSLSSSSSSSSSSSNTNNNNNNNGNGPQMSSTTSTRRAGGRSTTTAFGDTFSFMTSSAHYTAPPVPSSSSSSSNAPPHPIMPVNPKPNSITVSRRQAGNPLLTFIKLTPWEHGDILADYVLGDTTCALYVSIRYHLLHPKYLMTRINEMKSLFRTRVIICHVDQEDNERPIQEITKIGIVHQWTLICVWSYEEAARYLETLRLYEKKGSEMLKGQENDTKSQIGAMFHEIRSVNKTDVATLAQAFGSISRVASSSMEELAMCPGLGEKKVKRIFYAFHQPFATTQRPVSSPNGSPSSATTSPAKRSPASTAAGASSSSSNTTNALASPVKA